MKALEIKQQLKKKLNKTFGYERFRRNQEAIINNILAKKNTFVVMPTGAGKSLCYQLPALIQQGTGLVISPLIALMKNQVDQLNALGIEATFFNSALSKKEILKIKEAAFAGKIKLLYISPEFFIKIDTVAFLQQIEIALVAIDEAHCISEWGHNFRPEYRKIRQNIDQLNKRLPVIALTATATPKVQRDILQNLSIEDTAIFKSSFNRPNLYYEVRPKTQIEKQLIEFIKRQQRKLGIVYCQSRKKVNEIATLLNLNGIQAIPYHAGLDTKVRIQNQDAFLNEQVQIIVATIAFGMGINKPNISFVIHHDIPKSLENYYQETGRAGRDGLPATCLLFYNKNDLLKLNRFNQYKTTAENEAYGILLQEIAAYVTLGVCRRKQLLHYFGETYSKDNCDHCDNCKTQSKKYAGKKLITTVLRIIQQTKERFDINHIVDLLNEIENEDLKNDSHSQLAMFDKGKETTSYFWESVIRQAVLLEFLEKNTECSTLKITHTGKEFFQKPFDIMLYQDLSYENIDTHKKDSANTLVGKSYDEALFKMLKILTKDFAKKKNIPPYAVFQDTSLEEMAIVYPTSIQALSQIYGINFQKATKLGDPFIELINKYVEDNNIITVSHLIIKSQVSRSKKKIAIIQQVDKQRDLEDIANSQEITMQELIRSIEQIFDSGTKLNLDYYINRILTKDKQNEIYDYFMNAETDNIEQACKVLDDDFYEEDIRLMRIRFLSEVGSY